MKFYVYKITNTVNSKIYIGQTTESLEKRFLRHCGYLLKDQTHLHRAIQKYGVNKFSIHLIEEVSNQNELDEREFYWILYYNSVNLGYNIKNVKGKCGGDTLSNHPNLDEIKQKISESKKGSKNPNARKVKTFNIQTKEEFIYDSFKDCLVALNIKDHSIIGRRCLGNTKKPYKDLWEFCYVD